MTFGERVNGYKEGLSEKKWTWRGLIALVLIAVIAVIAWFALNRGNEDELAVDEGAARVEVTTFEELVKGRSVRKTAIIEPATHAPLVTRTGGRVTEIKARLGSTVVDGEIVVEIDGGREPNLAEVQLATSSAALGTFNNIEKLALASVNNAVEIAELGLKSAEGGKRISDAQVRKSREQADLSVRSAELALKDQLEAEKQVDAVVRASDIAFKAAGLAQDQATLAVRNTDQMTKDGIKQAEKGLEAAKITREKLIYDLQSQRISIQGQLAAAKEQVKMAQVITPINGQVTRLAVKRGDYVRPGEVVGEVLAYEGAQISLDVSTGVRNKLVLGRVVAIEAKGQKFEGEIARLASGPSAETALWQVDIMIASTPEIIHPGDLVNVVLPVGEQGSETSFVPLDVVTVRQDGIVLFTVGEDNVVKEHAVEVVGYTSDFVEGVIDEIELNDRVVVEGNRTLQAGEVVEIVS